MTLPGVTILAWRGTLQLTRWDRKLTRAPPFCAGTWLSHTASLEGFRRWDLIGITTLDDIWRDSQMKWFLELQGEVALHKSQLFR